MLIKSLLNLNGGVSFGKEHETAALSGNYDNFSIGDLPSVSVLVFNLTGDTKIRGLVSTNVNDWQVWLVVNNSDKKLKFEYNKGSSLADNRFTGDKAFDIKKNSPSWIMRNPKNNKFLVFKAD